MAIPDSTIRRILDQVRIEEIVAEYTHLTPKGDRLWGLSPFKPEKTPSFSVSPDKGLYYCFSTQKGGGAVQFIMEMERLSFPEAVEYLGKKVGIAIERSEEGSDSGDQRRALEDLYERVTGSFSHLLQKSPRGSQALGYIEGRGISRATIEKFELGFSPDDPYWLSEFLKKQGFSPDFLSESGLFSKKNPRWCIFAGRLIFPIRDHRGRVVAFGGRILRGDGPKYINSPETLLYKKSQVVYGLWQAKDAVRQAKSIVLCEGYMDVIALHESDIQNSGAPLGTAFTEEQARLISRYTKRCDLLFDEDEAGTSATMKAVQLLESKEFDVRIISLPSGKDPGELLQKSGSQALTNAVYSSSNVLDYLVRKAVSVNDVSTPSGKESAVEQLFRYVGVMVSAVRREAALDAIAESLGTTIESIREDFARFLGRGERRPQIREVVDQAKRNRPAMTPDLYLMIVVAIHFEEFPRVRMALSPRTLPNPWARELYIILEELYRDGQTTQDAILGRISDPELRDLYVARIQSGEFSIEPGRILDQALLRVRLEELGRNRAELETKIRSLSGSTAKSREIEELQKEKMFLDSQLEELKLFARKKGDDT